MGSSMLEPIRTRAGTSSLSECYSKWEINEAVSVSLCRRDGDKCMKNDADFWFRDTAGGYFALHLIFMEIRISDKVSYCDEPTEPMNQFLNMTELLK